MKKILLVFVLGIALVGCGVESKLLKGNGIWVNDNTEHTLLLKFLPNKTLKIKEYYGGFRSNKGIWKINKSGYIEIHTEKHGPILEEDWFQGDLKEEGNLLTLKGCYGDKDYNKVCFRDFGIFSRAGRGYEFHFTETENKAEEGIVMIDPDISPRSIKNLNRKGLVFPETTEGFAHWPFPSAGNSLQEFVDYFETGWSNYKKEYNVDESNLSEVMEDSLLEIRDPKYRDLKIDENKKLFYNPELTLRELIILYERKGDENDVDEVKQAFLLVAQILLLSSDECDGVRDEKKYTCGTLSGVNIDTGQKIYR